MPPLKIPYLAASLALCLALSGAHANTLATAAAEDVTAAVLAADVVVERATPTLLSTITARILKRAITARSGSEVDRYCSLRGAEPPVGVTVVLVRYQPCGTRPDQNYYEAWYGGKTYWANEAALSALPHELQSVRERAEADIAPHTPAWRLAAEQSKLPAQTGLLDKLRKTGARGVALIESEIYDVSEYTENTGFKATVLNTGKKTIKYVTFSVRGTNAVKDPVRDPIRRTAVLNLRGVGPIEPDSNATYEFDEAWFTDLVQYHDIRSIKLEFMDGSSRTLTNVHELTLSASQREVLAD